MNQRYFIAAALVLGSVLVVGEPLSAQQTPPANGVPVQTIVTVEPRHGSNVPEIKREDVLVFEGKDRDPVTDWVPLQGDRADLEFFVLLDDSSSVSLGSQLDDIRGFINSQPSTTKVGVAYMQNGIARIAQNLTSDHAQAAKALRLPLGEAGANASPYFSLSDLVKKWPESKARREVLMVTDGIDRYYGEPDYNDPYLQAAIDDTQRAGILVYAIYNPGVGHFGHSYWQNYWGQLYLSRLSDETGAEAYYIGFTGAPVSFSPYLDEINHRLGHQYLLGFQAKPQKKSGLQQVKIRTEIQQVDLVAPRRIYVPAGQ
ncbi:MAG TPA: hypothetical protein VFO39_22200 [Candidatus Sulfotelmatobacter sp.]|nr:hypothetical protein [Candidatus Sulfotelmatobacter sp.]